LRRYARRSCWTARSELRMADQYRSPLQAERHVGRVVVGRVALATPPPMDPGAGLSPGEIRREPDLFEELVVGVALGAVAVRPAMSREADAVRSPSCQWHYSTESAA
jgi:hypothetical protein